ncbi:TRAM/LAG1/CLN8 domain [Trinorchestia longiramus]|nr:TRAM/LAG1/CLN8 domain [Trinorchestia longiramus]
MNRTWNEKFWLPDGYTWARLATHQESNYNLQDYVAYSIFVGFALLFARNYFIIPLILQPLGLKLKIRSKPYQPPSNNDELEILYKVNRARPPRKKLEETAERVGLSERRVERWLRRKALSMQMTTLEKFNDCGYQAIFYSFFTLYGLYAIVSKDFFWLPEKGWERYPFFYMTSDLWWYCVIDCGFYVTQTFLLLTQDRRHDFYQMLIHHVTCVFVGVACMTIRAVPLLALGIFLHEFGDIPLCLAKMFSYAGKNTYSDIFGVTFAVLWVCSRIIAYPLWVLFPVYKATAIIGVKLWFGLFVSQFLSTVFFILNILWTFEIVQSLKRKLTTNAHMTDGRSSQEELSDSDKEQTIIDAPKFTENKLHLVRRVPVQQSTVSRGW